MNDISKVFDFNVGNYMQKHLRNIKNENSSSQGDHKYNQATNTPYPSRSLKQKILRIITG